MKVKLLLVLFIMTLGFFLSGQDNRIILSIDEDDITVDEFMHIYSKNNNQVTEDNQKSIEDYLELFINFKLKVKEAESLGRDTLSSFVKELNGYRKTLAEPYFTNEEIIDNLVKEAYERKKYDLRASHILIMISPNAMPEDTLKAFNKINQAREDILNGKDFSEAAVEYSEDPSVADRPGRGGKMIKGNKGDLGYFTALNMVYPFENAAYNLEVGEVSQTIRTDFGYHLIKLTDKLEAMGEIEVAHLFIQTNDTMTEEQIAEKETLANNLYKRLMDGEKYVDLVNEYSDDKGSAPNGGTLPKFNCNRMVPEFIEAIAMLKDSGDISKPIQTSYGFHIIELHSKSGIKTFDEEKNDLTKKIKKDIRSQKSKELIIDDIKKENNFSVNEEGLKVFYRSVDSTIYQGKWEIPIGTDFSKTLFSLGNESYNQLQFAQFLKNNQKINKKEKINEFINKQFKEFINESCLAYEDSRLEEKHPEFKALMNEYRGGILLFDLTEDKVWSKAVSDTAGLLKYYEDNKQKYFWGDRIEATIYFVQDENYLDEAISLVKEGKSKEEVMETLNNDSVVIINARYGKYSKGDHKLIDKIAWENGISEVMDHNMKKAFVDVYNLLEPEQKTFEEARGLIIAGYQEYLESEWIKELRNKYTIKINKKVLKSISKK